MRLQCLLGLMILAELPGVAGYNGQTDEKLLVCVTGTMWGSDFFRAKKVAGALYETAGVSIEWRWGQTFCGSQGGFVINFVERVNPDSLNALAAAMPWEGVHIEVFMPKLRALVGKNDLPVVLGYVIAHELAHMLQMTNSHTDRGVMKADWSRNDLRDLASLKLGFTDHDISLIRSGMARRHAIGDLQLASRHDVTSPR